MPGTAGPNLGLVWGYSAHDDGWGLGSYNPAMALLDAITFLGVISAAVATPPGSPAAGDRYIVASSPTGAWTGHAKDLAIYRGGAWAFYTPKTDWRAYNHAASEYIRYNGSAWVSDGSTGTLALDDLSDVVAPTPSDGDVLTFDSGSGNWINDTPAGGVTTLDSLTDVVAGSPSDGDVLTFDSGSGHWVNDTPTGGSSGAYGTATSATASNSSGTLEVTGLSGTLFELVGTLLIPATNGITCTLQFYDATAAAYINANYDWERFYTGTDLSSGAQKNTGQSSIQIVDSLPNVGAVALAGLCFRLMVYTDNANTVRITGSLDFRSSGAGTNHYALFIGGSAPTTGAITRARIQTSSGNWNTGKFTAIPVTP